MKKIIKTIFAPFGRGSFWVIGLGGSVLWAFIYWLAYRVSPAVDFSVDTVAGAFLGAFGFSYVAQLIAYKK
jgi:hypothetical protein